MLRNETAERGLHLLRVTAAMREPPKPIRWLLLFGQIGRWLKSLPLGQSSVRQARRAILGIVRTDRK